MPVQPADGISKLGEFSSMCPDLVSEELPLLEFCNHASLKRRLIAADL